MALTEYEKSMARTEARRTYFTYLDKRIPELHKQGTLGADAAHRAKAEYWRRSK